MPIATVNPSTGETLETFDPHSPAEVERRLTLAASTFVEWRRVPMDERARRMTRAGEILDARKQEYGRLMTVEMGKPMGPGVAEAEKCALACRFYADHAADFLAPERVATDASESMVRYDPIGAVLAVMPWNFPFWQVIRFAAPALMAGNVGLLKHASNVPRCALAIEEHLPRRRLPRGRVPGPPRRFGRRREADRRPAHRGGDADRQRGRPERRVGAAAGAQIKKTVLELGGSDPFIVMPSADIAKRRGDRGARAHDQQRAVAASRPSASSSTRRSPRSSRGASSRG